MAKKRTVSGETGVRQQEEATCDLRTLVTFQMRQLTYMNSRSAASEYERKFKITMNEWRIMALIYQEEELSLNGLAEQGQFDRGLASRVVAALTERGYVDRQVNGRDARGVVLSLTPAGVKLVLQVFAVAQERNQKLTSCLTRVESEVLRKALVKMRFQARVMFDLEREQAGSSPQAKPPARWP
jgi:DNA-binding MarR family transcriptional regulator